MQYQKQEPKSIRFIILGTPYSIKPTDELPAEDIHKLVRYIKGLVDSYSQKGFDEQKIPILVAFQVANDMQRLQDFYEVSLHQFIEKLQVTFEENA